MRPAADRDPSPPAHESWRRGTDQGVCLHSKSSCPTGRWFSRLRSVQGPRESIALDDDHTALRPRNGAGRLCSGSGLSGVTPPCSVSGPALTFLAGHAATFWLPQLELSGPAGQTEEYKHGCPHFWPVQAFLAFVLNGKQEEPTGREFRKGAQASQVAVLIKNRPANAGDSRDEGWIPGTGRAPGEGLGNPLQYSCQENPMDRGA